MSTSFSATTIQELKWTKLGQYFGYPNCCIIDFCERGYTMTEEQEAVHSGTGFVPCPNCAGKILRGEATLEGLLLDRQCPMPFPNDDLLGTRRR